MNFAIIGTGGRSLAYLGLIRNQSGHAVTALCDTDATRLETYRLAHFPEGGPACVSTRYEDILADDSVDTVLICTPDTTHREIAIAALDANKAMLLEKPVATTVADVRALERAFEGYSRPVYLGFVLRYTPLYRQIHSIVRSGSLGRIVTASARETLDPRHAGSFFRRWHRFSRNNGGLMNAKCSHDLDLLNWIIGDEPVLVSAFGGRSVFVPRPEVPDRCGACPEYASCSYAFPYEYYRNNFGSFHSLSDLCVYNSEKDIVDHECLMIHYAEGVVAQFELCLFGSAENRTMEIHGTKGSLLSDFARQTITTRQLDGTEVTVKVDGSGEGHGGGDEGLLADLVDSVEGFKTVNHVRAGCLATLIALAGETSMATGSTVEIKDMW